jgi:hypothetical protein
LIKHNQGVLDFLASRLPGKKRALMELVTLAAELELGLAPLALAWAQVPKLWRSKISLDALCETAVPEIGTARVVGLVAEAALAWGWLDVGNLFAALNHEKVVRASVKRALQKDGYHDRRIQFIHSEFIADAHHAEAEAQAAAGAKVATPGLPAFETDAIEMAKWVRDIDETAEHTG